jgi:hypothetical protein
MEHLLSHPYEKIEEEESHMLIFPSISKRVSASFQEL